MKAHSLSATAGWRWLTDSWRIYRRAPAQLLFVVSLYWIVVLVLNIVPLVGPLMAAIAIPGLSVGVMNACRDLDEGRVPPTNALFSAFRGSGQTLLTLGVLYLSLTMLVLLLAALVDGGEFVRSLMTGKRPDDAAVESGDSLWSALLLFSLLLPLMMAYWFGPMLAAWYRLPAIKALFFSLVACAMNWKPFLVYALSLLAMVVIPFVALGVAVEVFPRAASTFSFLLSLPVLLCFVPVVFASFYVSYREIFGVSEIV